jgi:hypothetical protein
MSDFPASDSLTIAGKSTNATDEDDAEDAEDVFSIFLSFSSIGMAASASAVIDTANRNGVTKRLQVIFSTF